MIIELAEHKVVLLLGILLGIVMAFIMQSVWTLKHIYSKKISNVNDSIERFKDEMSYLKRVHKYPAKDIYKFMCKKIDEVFGG